MAGGILLSTYDSGWSKNQKANQQVHWNIFIRKLSIKKPAAAKPVADTDKKQSYL